MKADSWLFESFVFWVFDFCVVTGWLLAFLFLSAFVGASRLGTFLAMFFSVKSTRGRKINNETEVVVVDSDDSELVADPLLNVDGSLFVYKHRNIFISFFGLLFELRHCFNDEFDFFFRHFLDNQYLFHSIVKFLRWFLGYSLRKFIDNTFCFIKTRDFINSCWFSLFTMIVSLSY